MPDNLTAAVAAERAKYSLPLSNQQQVDICNAVAWAHRADGWGLSRKPGGNHGVLSNGTPVAVDILFHQPSRTVWDVLIGDDRHAGFLAVTTYDFAGRPWVAPVQPAGGPGPDLPPPPPPPPPTPSTDLSALRADVAGLRAEVKSLSGAVSALTTLLTQVAGPQYAELVKLLTAEHDVNLKTGGGLLGTLVLHGTVGGPKV